MTWKCDYCGNEFDTRKEAEKHENGCTRKIGVWECETCGKEFDTKRECDEHEINCNSNKRNKNQIQEYKRTCNQCGKVWHSLVAREKELEGDVKCNACIGAGTAFGDMGTASQSIRNAQAQKTSLYSLRLCPQCGSQNYKEEIISYDKK